MRTAMFIRTFCGDAAWLHELFRSIRKFVSGFDEIVVHCDDDDVGIIDPVVPKDLARLVHTGPWTPHGYCNQQLCKVGSDLWTGADLIYFADSDYLFTGPTTPASFIVGGKPQILKTPYEALGNTVDWQRPTEVLMKRPVAYEFMRGPRLTFWRDTIFGLRRYLSEIHGAPDVFAFLAKHNSMSEFNLIGAFAHEFHRDRYSWLNTETEPLPHNPVRQFWSWGKITPEVRAEIERILA